MRLSIEDRFWMKVCKTNGCWFWTGNCSQSGKGYGAIGSGGKYGKLIPAHRLSWEIHNGPVPAGRWVLHKCDNKACVNPEHLLLGDVHDNAIDAARKGLLGRNQKLSPYAVKIIRRMWRQGRSGTDISRVFGITAAHARKVARGIAWSHL